MMSSISTDGLTDKQITLLIEIVKDMQCANKFKKKQENNQKFANVRKMRIELEEKVARKRQEEIDVRQKEKQKLEED